MVSKNKRRRDVRRSVHVYGGDLPVLATAVSGTERSGNDCTKTWKVYTAIKSKDLGLARTMISYLVGRDTQSLSFNEIIKATVETVAENTSDGVIAPMLFMAIGGAPLGFLYKGVNTMDSMVGYKNEKYINFGYFPAKMDDIFNFIPARVSGLLMIVAAFLCGYDGKGAARIFFRDRNNHLSPNSAQTESACAGALDIQLGGTHDYFGKPVVKPTIGDDINEPEAEHIRSLIYKNIRIAW